MSCRLRRRRNSVPWKREARRRILEIDVSCSLCFRCALDIVLMREVLEKSEKVMLWKEEAKEARKKDKKSYSPFPKGGSCSWKHLCQSVQISRVLQVDKDSRSKKKKALHKVGFQIKVQIPPSFCVVLVSLSSTFFCVGASSELFRSHHDN